MDEKNFLVINDGGIFYDGKECAGISSFLDDMGYLLDLRNLSVSRMFFGDIAKNPELMSQIACDGAEVVYDDEDPDCSEFHTNGFDFHTMNINAVCNVNSVDHIIERNYTNADNTDFSIDGKISSVVIEEKVANGGSFKKIIIRNLGRDIGLFTIRDFGRLSAEIKLMYVQLGVLYVNYMVLSSDSYIGTPVTACFDIETGAFKGFFVYKCNGYMPMLTKKFYMPQLSKNLMRGW